MMDASVCAVISCGQSKRELEPGETIDARLLYDSSIHTCKDRFARQCDGYYIMSALHGLVAHDMQLRPYDKSLETMSENARLAWGRRVARELTPILEQGGFDAVVFIGGRTYVEALEPRFDELPAAVLTPWQTDDYVTGVGRGAAWCNDELHWPANVDRLEDIGEIVSPAPSDVNVEA